MTKELANMRQLSLDALKEADLKIQNIESKLAKEREDHRNQVKFLKEDAEQVGVSPVFAEELASLIVLQCISSNHLYEMNPR